MACLCTRSSTSRCFLLGGRAVRDVVVTARVKRRLQRSFAQERVCFCLHCEYCVWVGGRWAGGWRSSMLVEAPTSVGFVAMRVRLHRAGQTER